MRHQALERRRRQEQEQHRASEAMLRRRRRHPPPLPPPRRPRRSSTTTRARAEEGAGPRSPREEGALRTRPLLTLPPRLRRLPRSASGRERTGPLRGEREREIIGGDRGFFFFLFARPRLVPPPLFFILSPPPFLSPTNKTEKKTLFIVSQMARRPLGQRRRRGSRRGPSGRTPRSPSCRWRPRRSRPSSRRRGCRSLRLFRRRILFCPHRRRWGPARRRRAARPLGRLHGRRICPRPPPRVGPRRGEGGRSCGGLFREGRRRRRRLWRWCCCWKQQQHRGRWRRLRLSLGDERRSSGERRARGGTQRRRPPPPPREPRPIRLGREGLWRRPRQRRRSFWRRDRGVFF